MPDISWKIVSHFSIILLTNTYPESGKSTLESRGLPQHPENVPACSLSHVQPLLKISWKAVHLFSSNVANIHGFSWKHRKKKPVTSGLNFPDCSLYHAWHIRKISWKSVHAFFHHVTNRWTNQQRRKCNLHCLEKVITSVLAYASISNEKIWHLFIGAFLMVVQELLCVKDTGISNAMQYFCYSLQNFLRLFLQMLASYVNVTLLDVACQLKFAFQLHYFVFGIALHWILSPEPQGNQLDIPLVEDVLISQEYLASEEQNLWLRRKLLVSPEQIQQTAELTVGQRENALWAAARKLRFTSSNFGAIISAAGRNRWKNSFTSIELHFNFLCKWMQFLYLSFLKIVMFACRPPPILLQNFHWGLKSSIILLHAWVYLSCQCSPLPLQFPNFLKTLF